MKCKFCQNETERLEVSHIIPKFIYRWIKKTGTTGRLRDGRNMKRPAQDGLKEEMLCSACENNFSAFETYFANKKFSQMTGNDGVVITENTDWEKFNKFMNSLLWRTLYFSTNTKEVNGNYTASEIIAFNACAEVIKNAYVEGKEIPLDTYFIPLNKNSYSNGIIKFEDYVYFERSVSVNLIVDDANGAAVTLYIKLPYALIVCEIMNCENHKWNGLKLNDRPDLNRKDSKIPKNVHDYLKFDCNRCYEMAKDIPMNQVEKINKIYLKKGSPEDGSVKSIIKNKNREFTCISSDLI